MNINITVSGTALTAPISEYVEKKLQSLIKLLDTKGDKEVLVRVELRKYSSQIKGEVFTVEVHLGNSGSLYDASATESDLYSAIDSVRDELAREIKDAKGRRWDRMLEGGRSLKDMLKND